jgi:hypothetical protein
VIDRIDDVSDPMLDYFGAIGGYMGGGIRGMGVLAEKSFTVKLELNDWFRFDEPGMYTLAVRSRRVTDESVAPHAVVPVESNGVSFEILPRDATWEASALDTARRIVDAQRPSVGARAGCRMMRFLGSEAAAMEMISRYGADTDQGCDFDYMIGLLWDINGPWESNIELAQYRFTSITALKGKLVRYPRGTAFIVPRSANESGDVTAAISALMAFAASQGLSIKDQGTLGDDIPELTLPRPLSSRARPESITTVAHA